MAATTEGVGGEIRLARTSKCFMIYYYKHVYGTSNASNSRYFCRISNMIHYAHFV